MARIIIKIEIEPDPDCKHCGDCHLVERGGWCSAFDVRLDGSIGRWDCCSECLAARVPGKHTSQVLDSLWTAVRCAQQRLADLDAMDLDEREDHHDVEVVRLQQTMELHETAAAEIERLSVGG